jgi:hypothetical protein
LDEKERRSRRSLWILVLSVAAEEASDVTRDEDRFNSAVLYALRAAAYDNMMVLIMDARQGCLSLPTTSEGPHVLGLWTNETK